MVRAQRGEYDTIDVRFRIYDVLWALALALNQTMTMVESLDISGTSCESMNGSLVPLHQFDYTNAMMGCLIQWNLQQTDFFGMSVSMLREYFYFVYIPACFCLNMFRLEFC